MGIGEINRPRFNTDGKLLKKQHFVKRNGKFFAVEVEKIFLLLREKALRRVFLDLPVAPLKML
ncbi:MAG: hypothetical protein LH614_18180 [Pyrinomonadaceae bacterium]|nr:hypothetical protein [Pyrinomonadaceae bacterium]